MYDFVLKHLRWLAFTWITFFFSSSSLAADIVIMDGAVQLEPTRQWVKYNGSDAPAGGFITQLSPGISSVQAVLVTPPIPVGTYHVFVKFNDADRHGRLIVRSDCDEASAETDDRDKDKYWTYLGQLTFKEQLNRLPLEYRKLVSPEISTKGILRGIYLTTDPSVRVTAQDFVVSTSALNLATRHTSNPVKGNRLPNASFELGLSGGWGGSKGDSSADPSEFWSATGGINGSGCMRIPNSGPSRGSVIFSKPFPLRGNRQHSLSLSARSTTTSRVTVEFVLAKNADVVVEGKNPLKLEKDVGSKWQRLEIIQTLPGDSVDEYFVKVTGYSIEDGETRLDEIQVEEGGVTPFATRSTIELGVESNVPGRIFFSDEETLLTVTAFNSTREPYNGTVRYEVFNHQHSRLISGSLPIVTLAGKTTRHPLRLTLPEPGAFRINLWVDGIGSTEEESVFSVIPRPVVPGAESSSMLGTHSDLVPSQYAMFHRLGIKWIRLLSPGAYFRWSLTEPTEGQYVWYDDAVGSANEAGFSLLGNLGARVPTWAFRTYFALTNVSGTGFRVGERLVGPLGSGTITTVLDTRHVTGHALQLQNVSGTLRKGDIVVGQTSNTRATLRTTVFPSTPALDKWETFVRQVATHYRGKVAAWEIWNEPNQDPTQLPAPDGDNAFYAEILKRASAIIRQSDPSSAVAGFGGIFQPAYAVGIGRQLGTNAPNVCDVLTYHLYPGNGGLSTEINRQMKPIYGKDVWNTETGFWDLGSYIGVNANFTLPGKALIPYRESDRFYRSTVSSPDSVAINFLESIGGGFTKYFYYDARPAASPGSFSTHPTLLEYDRTVRAKGITFAILGSRLRGATGTGRITGTDPAVHVYAFDRSGRGILALWTTDRKNRSWVPPGILPRTGWEACNLMGVPIPAGTGSIVFGRSPVCLFAPAGVSAASLAANFRSGSIALVPDTTPPLATITVAPRGTVTAESPLRIRWIASDNQDIPEDPTPNAIVYSYKFSPEIPDWTPWNSATLLTIPSITAGEHEITVRARDASGNESAPITRSFNAEPR